MESNKMARREFIGGLAAVQVAAALEADISME
jgi:hypothetical protein